jgi:hypothetical protein
MKLAFPNSITTFTAQQADANARRPSDFHSKSKLKLRQKREPLDVELVRGVLYYFSAGFFFLQSCNPPPRGHRSMGRDWPVNRPMHVSSRDSPQSLEFWEDGRLSLQNRIFWGLLPDSR